MQRVFFIILIIEFEKTIIVFGFATPRLSEQLNRVQLVKALTDSIIYFFYIFVYITCCNVPLGTGYCLA